MSYLFYIGLTDKNTSLPYIAPVFLARDWHYTIHFIAVNWNWKPK
ncbi:MAG: hypothetical protein OEZ43_00480 [Gammaproteobacteria bacterium]|nr:hypothetical protein [Gammaproteobacteria bacterium]